MPRQRSPHHTVKGTCEKQCVHLGVMTAYLATHSSAIRAHMQPRNTHSSASGPTSRLRIRFSLASSPCGRSKGLYPSRHVVTNGPRKRSMVSARGAIAAETNHEPQSPNQRTTGSSSPHRVLLPLGVMRDSSVMSGAITQATPTRKKRSFTTRGSSRSGTPRPCVWVATYRQATNCAPLTTQVMIATIGETQSCMAGVVHPQQPPADQLENTFYS